MKLPDDYIEGLRQREDAVDEKKFATAEWMSDFWVEYQTAIKAEGKDYKWEERGKQCAILIHTKKKRNKRKSELRVDIHK